MSSADIASALGGDRREGRAWRCRCPLQGSRTVMTACEAPRWAVLSAPGITALILPPEARNAVICADHDASGVGQRAAHDAAARWLAEDRRIGLGIPPRGHDG